MARIAKSYRVNLIRALRARERKTEQKRRRQLVAGITCFALLVLALVYSGFTIWKMERVLSQEKVKLESIKAEYRKYTATRMIVDKGDVELLNSLQGRGIFWTKKLASLATHLPENYTITNFTYSNGDLNVSGYGFISPRQDQLLILDEYLNRLRADTTFSDTFKELYLNSASRKEDVGSGKVAFEFSALNVKGGRAQ